MSINSISSINSNLNINSDNNNNNNNNLSKVSGISGSDTKSNDDSRDRDRRRKFGIYGNNYAKTDSPCMICLDRYIGCHSECKKYIEWNSNRLDRKKQMTNEKYKDYEIVSYEVNRSYNNNR